ncbi:putative enzyme related to lactoylglutathione lyase [Bacillus pakistanensis]|uniref:Enzyme related to lactoylglutathione lyase n=1 Tax=Rossellomorea pakistanensis TaxID=992288 RepID=A0ABS2NCL6_9BACI|nr:VOC family protein [Bacillus pakistanensis]MBM7585499.1 putative enzyme related to lactoylglutathione lyase [Bacillus pakistanensis]
MLNKVCVITVKVDRMSAAIDFYTKVLDFKISKHYGERIVSLVHNEIPIVLEETELNNVGKQNVLIGIHSNDLDKDFDLLKKKGAKILFDEPKPCPPGRYIIIEDPAGNQIELVEFSDE